MNRAHHIFQLNSRAIYSFCHKSSHDSLFSCPFTLCLHSVRDLYIYKYFSLVLFSVILIRIKRALIHDDPTSNNTKIRSKFMDSARFRCSVPFRLPVLLFITAESAHFNRIWLEFIAVDSLHFRIRDAVIMPHFYFICGHIRIHLFSAFHRAPPYKFSFQFDTAQSVLIISLNYWVQKKLITILAKFMRKFIFMCIHRVIIAFCWMLWHKKHIQLCTPEKES